jgi:hypothetical protein
MYERILTAESVHTQCHVLNGCTSCLPVNKVSETNQTQQFQYDTTKYIHQDLELQELRNIAVKLLYIKIIF